MWHTSCELARTSNRLLRTCDFAHAADDKVKGAERAQLATAMLVGGHHGLQLPKELLHLLALLLPILHHCCHLAAVDTE